jgi:hypothetical protein
MPPDRSAGILSATSGCQPHHLQLDQGRVAHQRGRQRLELAQRKGDVLQHGEGREQRPVLEQHADPAGSATLAQSRGRLAQHFNGAPGRRFQPQNLAQQHRLARARAAHQRNHLAALHAEVQVLVHHKRWAELGPQLADVG